MRHSTVEALSIPGCRQAFLIHNAFAKLGINSHIQSMQFIRGFD
jgi:hypothetical protein